MSRKCSSENSLLMAMKDRSIFPEVPPEKTAPSTNVSDEDHVHGYEESD